MQTRTLATELGDVTIREWGEGDRLLLALHALGPVSTGALYNCAVAPLVEAGYHVVAPDLPGYGLMSLLPAEEYDVERLADRMWCVADALGGTRITLVGHSWGGAIAMRMQQVAGPRLDALVLVDSGHLDYADVNGADADLSLEDWVQRARDRRLVVPDRAALAEALEVVVDDPLTDDLLLGMVEEDGQLVSRVTPEAQGAAMFHLGRASQTETWPALQGEQIPTLLLLATEPPATFAQNQRAAHAFKAVIHDADVQLLEGATHSWSPTSASSSDSWSWSSCRSRHDRAPEGCTPGPCRLGCRRSAIPESGYPHVDVRGLSAER
jgi:pimeloyl-ACP methyl ester carboxylesterase